MPVQRGIQQTGSRGHSQPFYQGAANQRGAAPPRPSGKDNFVSPGPLTVNVNCFEITNLPNILYYQYDVISPDVFNRARCSQIIDRLQNHVRPDIFQKRAIYDGKKILYATKYPLQLVSNEGQSFTVNMSDTGSKIFTVKLSPVNLDSGINVGVLRSIISGADAHNQLQKAIEPTTVLQLLIRAAPNLGTSGHGMDIHQVRSARAYYTDVGALKIGGGLELWQGFFQSARPAIGRMLVNVDTSMSAMYLSGHLINVALNALGHNDIRALRMREKDEGFRMLKNFLKGVFILVDIHGDTIPAPNSRKKKIIDIISYVALDQYTFVKDGAVTTVKDYFKWTYNKDIAISPFGIVTGNKERPAIIPAQFCWVVPGQFYKKKVPSRYTDDVVRFATKSPHERLKTILGGIGNNATHSLSAPALEYETSHFITDAQMTVSKQLVKIVGEILEPPTLKFFKPYSETPHNGVWNVMKKNLYLSVRLGQWAVVDLSGRKDGGDARIRFIRELEGCLRNLGMLINRKQVPRIVVIAYLSHAAPPTPDVTSGSGYAAAKLLKSVFDNGAGFILVILPERAEEVRNIVKHTGDIVLGVPTQCVKEDKMVSANNQYCNNLALKINARLGGVNSVPSSSFLNELGKQPFMVFGADASHPGAGVQNQPSIASLVWSTNETATTYAAISGVQDPGQEMILSLESMLTFALSSFVESSGCPPVRIIFFRDGLSNSQFEEVGTKEIEIIAKVIHQNSQFWISRNWAPPLVTFVVVGKRHHIRFFPIDGRGADKKGNVQAGFLAEEGLKSPFHRDYFLQSHGGLLGTSRPSHYTVLKDDCFKKMPHLLQELSFALCHCYASATRSVSIPAPTYYADKVCQRAKFHYAPEGDDSSVSSDTVFDLPYWQHRYKPINRRLAKTMYFV